MLERVIHRARCPQCRGGLIPYVFEEGDNGHIRAGIAACTSCNAVYPIDDELLLLCPQELMPAELVATFFAKFAAAIAAHGVGPQTIHYAATPDKYRDQLSQREHFDWFAANEDLSYSDYAQTPFWLAADELVFEYWTRNTPQNDWLLDVGSANGRAIFPMMSNGMTGVGIDVSVQLLRQAIERSKQNGLHGSTCFAVADGNDLPFVDMSFDRVMTYGVLHHLPNPEAACKEFQRVLSRGGIYLGSENHESPLRPLFDMSMKLLPLWQEKAGAEPLISKAKLDGWHSRADVEIHARYRVFLPPHLFNALGKRVGLAVMRMTDAVFNAFPYLRKAGGLIVYEVRAREI
jgi:SAM-dependent methyltransferase/uncharacterized protein YbaR (Trm112 family)